MNIMNCGIREKYDPYAKFGDKLAEMDKMINWDGFRSILSDLYNNNTEKGGAPNFDLYRFTHFSSITV